MKVKVLAKRALISIGAVALLGSLGAAAISYKMNVALTKTNQEQAGRIKTLTDDVRKLEGRLATSDGDLKDLRSQTDANHAELEKLKDNVDAFATQAAACDTLRRSMKGGA